jgi:hypothetical protein
MAKIPFDPSDLAEIIAAELRKAGKTASSKAVNDIMQAVGGATKSTGKRVPKITAKTATGGAGRKPPKPPKSGAAAPAPKPKGPKKPSGGAKKMTRLEKREINVARHKEERAKWLQEKAVESQANKEAKSAANRAAWAKRQEEMEARRLAGREKYNKKKGTK